jgi:hypothetical protein
VLGTRGFVRRERGAHGLFVQDPRSCAAHAAAAELLTDPVRACLSLGLTAEQIRRIALDACDRQPLRPVTHPRANT